MFRFIMIFFLGGIQTHAEVVGDNLPILSENQTEHVSTIEDLSSTRFTNQLEMAKQNKKIELFVVVDPSPACGKPKLVLFQRNNGVLVKTHVFDVQTGDSTRETPQGFFPGKNGFLLEKANRRPTKTKDVLLNFVQFKERFGICSEKGIIDPKFLNGGLIVMKHEDSGLVYALFSKNVGKVQMLVEKGVTQRLFPTTDCALISSILPSRKID